MHLRSKAISHFPAGCFDRWFTEKRQEEEERITDTKLFEKEEGQEEG
jgi:hypothetical protein